MKTPQKTNASKSEKKFKKEVLERTEKDEFDEELRDYLRRFEND